MPVTRIEQTPQGIWAPKSTAPATDDPLDHLLFALKHEGINLPIIVQAVSRISPERLLKEIRATPNGANIRKACYLWETYTGNTLDGIPSIWPLLWFRAWSRTGQLPRIAASSTVCAFLRRHLR